jgi:hypothetical protein
LVAKSSRVPLRRSSAIMPMVTAGMKKKRVQNDT